MIVLAPGKRPQLERKHHLHRIPLQQERAFHVGEVRNPRRIYVDIADCPGGTRPGPGGALRPSALGSAASGAAPNQSRNLRSMRQTNTELHLSRLEKELSSRTAGAATETEIQHVLQQALRDLKGSVSRESLPEMAARLAAARLDAADRKVLTTV